MSADTDQRIELEYPPGFAGMALGRSADELRARARALATELAQYGAGDVQQLTEQLALVGARFSRFDVRVFGQFAVGDTDPALATMTLAASALETDDAEGIRRNRRATASAMLRQYQQRHPDADARVVQLPSGPAVAAVIAGEFRLPAEQFGEGDADGEEVVRPLRRAEFQLVTPDGASVIVLDVSTGSESGWPAVAEQAARTVRSIRVTDPSGEAQD